MAASFRTIIYLIPFSTAPNLPHAPVLLPRKRSLPHACPATLHSSRCTSKYHKLSREAAQVRLLRIVSLCTSARQNQTC